MDKNTNSDSWSTNIRGKEVAIFSASSAESYCLEPLVHEVYQGCSNTPCSTLNAIASMTLVRKTGLSHTS
jgi:hypothetical protein